MSHVRLRRQRRSTESSEGARGWASPTYTPIGTTAHHLRQNRASLAALEVGKGKPRGVTKAGVSTLQTLQSAQRAGISRHARRVKPTGVFGERRTAGRAPVVASLAGKCPARARIGSSNGFIS